MLNGSTPSRGTTDLHLSACSEVQYWPAPEDDEGCLRSDEVAQPSRLGNPARRQQDDIQVGAATAPQFDGSIASGALHFGEAVEPFNTPLASRWIVKWTPATRAGSSTAKRDRT